MNELKKIIATPSLKALNIEAINEKQTIGRGKLKSGFKDTFTNAKLIKASVDHFKTKECKHELELIGINWTIEQYMLNAFNLEKSWCYKLFKALTFEAKVEQYLSIEATNYSIALFLAFCNDKPKAETEKPILSLTYGEIKVKINAKNELTSENTKAELLAIITRLTAEMSKMK